MCGVARQNCAPNKPPKHAADLPAQRSIIGGDASEPAISAASILAKTYRDTLMEEEGVLTGATNALDFGCGTGLLTLPLAERIARVTGLDTSPGMYGRVENHQGPDGNYLPLWVDWQDIVGVPYDIPIVGYGNRTVNFLRLFAARSTDSFDMQIFDQGDYIKAIHQKVYSELISKVLYPSESISFGRELRLIQEFFLVFCSLRDITRRFLKQNRNIEELPEYAAIQLNDTHPALAVAELMAVNRSGGTAPLSERNRMTAEAREVESSQLDGNRAEWMGLSSVCPTT